MKIKKEIYDKLLEHARGDAPIEACGYLASQEGVVIKHFELTNIDQSEVHFAFDPQEQFNVVRTARAEGLDVSGTYHSHPATPARPSEEDINLAYDPGISYVIVSLADGHEDIKSFKIVEGDVQPEELEVVT